MTLYSFIAGFIFGFFGTMALVLFLYGRRSPMSREDSIRLNEELKRWRR